MWQYGQRTKSIACLRARASTKPGRFLSGWVRTTREPRGSLPPPRLPLAGAHAGQGLLIAVKHPRRPIVILQCRTTRSAAAAARVSCELPETKKAAAVCWSACFGARHTAQPDAAELVEPEPPLAQRLRQPGQPLPDSAKFTLILEFMIPPRSWDEFSKLRPQVDGRYHGAGQLRSAVECRDTGRPPGENRRWCAYG